MYKFVCLGTGNAFCLEGNYQSNFLIISPDGDKLLIDCGSDARRSLHTLGYSVEDIDTVYVSHLHSDHIGGLEWLAFCTYFNPATPRPKLYAHESLIAPLWEQSLQGGLRSIFEKSVGLADYFDVNPLTDDCSWLWCGLEIKLVFSFHVQDDGVECPCYGLVVTSPDTTVYFTADIRFCPDYCDPMYKTADLIIHDCETTSIKSGVHANYIDLITLPTEYKEKMLLYHYHDRQVIDIEKDRFKGILNPSSIVSF